MITINKALKSTGKRENIPPIISEEVWLNVFKIL
jgi:hypothetical protein